jgi:chromosome segregation protein
MYLKRIEMLGFKSFADKTVISFVKGVTAIVGPNGCGKSNISDAIRWVLGEKSYKMLRGDKMEDMVFNGTEFRKSLGYCEVSMVFSNEDKVLPVEYTEVEITRKYFRGGESEYYINRTPCRQKDIYTLLMDTGIGSNSYSMVEQGRIDYIVRASADERRFLIEEAAGISKYKFKKEEALRKLERTENNLLRINDIVTEVEKNIKYAERQARKAERFKESYEVLKRLETYKAFQEIDSLTCDRDQLQEKKTLREREQETFSTSLGEKRANVAGQNAAIDELNSVISGKEEERYKKLNEIDRLKSKKEFNIIRTSEMNARNHTSAITIEETERKLAYNREQVIIKEGEYAAFKEEFGQFNNERSAKRSALHDIRVVIEELTAQCESYEKELFTAASLLAALRNERNSIGIQVANIENQIVRIGQEKEKLSQEQRNHEVELGDKQAVLRQHKDEFDHFRGQYEKLKALKMESEAELERTRNAVLNDRVLHKEIEARLRVLEDLEKNYSGFKDGAKNALNLKTSDNPLFTSIATLVSLLNVHEGYEQAIQAVLSDRIYSVVASSHKEAYEIIRHLKDNNLGQINILINRADVALEDGIVPYDPGFIFGEAIDFVTVTDGNKYILKELLKNTLVISNDVEDHYQEIVELSRNFRLVTLGGLVIGPHIYMSGGSDSESNAALLMRDRKIKEMHGKIDEVTQSLQLHTSHENNLIGQLSDIRAELERFEESVYDRRLKIETAEEVSRASLDRAEKVTMQIAMLTREQEERVFDKERLIREEAEKGTRVAELETRYGQLKELVEQEKGKLRDKHPEKEAVQMELAGLEAKINGLSEKDAFLTSALNAIRRTIEEDERYIEKMREEMVVNERTISELTAENTTIEGTLTELERTLRGLEVELTRMVEDRDVASLTLRALEDEVNKVNAELEICREELHECSMKIMDLTYRESAIHDRLLQTYKIEIKAVDRASLALDENECANIDTVIRETSAKVEAMGVVNTMAVEEYETLQQRYEFLTTQRNDLETARVTLLEAIRKINRTTKKLFLDVYEHVKRYFNEYYKVLFKGGHAELILLDGENPLESGIDIFVRPPGKKLQNISLLSGGEKALTAIALLFAVFKVKPSPYCVLDEVDAPLDEANIDRFLDVLRDFLTTTQFLIVTHNRKTITMADTLFGITMEEAGVSKVVSVKLGEESKFIDHIDRKADKRDTIYKPKKNFNLDKIDELVGVKDEQYEDLSKLTGGE